MAMVKVMESPSRRHSRVNLPWLNRLPAIMPRVRGPLGEAAGTATCQGRKSAIFLSKKKKEKET
jgi:hypothetical protein